jgi:tRNA threonylcarbamoyl adenosine modification protein YjeE
MIALARSTTSPEHTAALATGLADLLAFSDVLALHGPLGAGKTTFTRALAQALGTRQGLASSPTFVMINQYPFTNPRLGSGQLIHVDAYRLSSAEDIDSLGWDALFDPYTRLARDRSIALIEWADRIKDALPPDEQLATLTITPTGEHTRSFDFRFPAAWQSRPNYELFASNVPTRCPATQSWVAPTSPTYPFASQHAKMADLHRWFTGGYTISRDLEPDDLSQ